MRILKIAFQVVTQSLSIKEYGKAIYILRQTIKALEKKLDYYNTELKSYMGEEKAFESDGTIAKSSKIIKYKWDMNKLQNLCDSGKLDKKELFIEETVIKVNEAYLNDIRVEGILSHEEFLELMQDKSYTRVTITPSKDLKKQINA